MPQPLAQSNAMRRHRDRGATIPLVALALPVLMIMTAFAVDLGRQRVLRRDLQADADVIALDLVRLADGRSTSEIESDPTYLTYVNGSFGRNGVAPVSSLAELDGVVTYGTWDDTGGFDETGDPPDAVRVTLGGELDYFFQPGTGSAERSADAVREGVGVFSVGSRLANVDTADSPLIDPVLDMLFQGLDPVTGTSPGDAVRFNAAAPAQAEGDDGIALSALSYEGLVGSDIALSELLGIIHADMVDSGIDVASPEDVLLSDVTLLHVVEASADALAASGGGASVDAAVAFLDALALTVDPDLTLGLGDLVNADVSTPGAVLATAVNAWDLLLVSAQAVNADHLLATDVALPSEPFAAIPVVRDVISPEAHVELTVIEAPQIGRGKPGDASASASTSQIELGLDVGVTLQVDLGLAWLPDLATVDLDVPLTLTVGNAAATLTGLDCDTADPSQSLLDLLVSTGAATLHVGDGASSFTDLAEVSLLGSTIADVDSRGSIPLSSLSDDPVHGLQVGATRSVDANQIGLASVLGTPGGIELSIDVLDDVLPSILGPFGGVLGFLLDELVDQVVAAVFTGPIMLALTGVFSAIDQLLLAPVLDLLGAGVAGADVSAVDAFCNSPKLVG